MPWTDVGRSIQMLPDMREKPDTLTQSYSEQLADFEDRLLGPLEDENVLAEIHASFKRLVDSDGDCETQIREILQNRFDAGELRSESVELVQKLLDQMTHEIPVLAETELFLVEDDLPATEEDLAAEIEAAAVEVEPPPVAVDPVAKADPRAYRSGNGAPQSGTLIGGRFLLQQELTGGSMGTLFQAVDERLAGAGGTTANVAIQILPAEISANARAMRALQQEVAKGRCLKHPNIVRFIDLEKDDDLNFIVMEKLDGKLLATVLEDTGNQKLDTLLSLDVVVAVAVALEFAHQRGVVHADINPGNIMITPSGELKLFDFGVARVWQTEPRKDPGEKNGESSGQSSAYSSMQVLTGEEPTVADDVFSLGCLLYRLITGFRVFGPRNAAAAAAEGMNPQKPQELNDTQWQALKKCLAYSRIPRFSSCAAFVAGLDGMTEPQPATEPGEPEPTRTVEKLPEKPSRKLWLLAAVGAVLAAAAVVVIFQAGPFGNATPLQPVPSTAAPVTPAVEDEGILVSDPLGEANLARTSADTDYSALLPATMTVGLAGPGQYIEVTDLTLREGGESATIDVVRMRNILESYTVQLEEVEVEDEDPVWGTGQYEVSNDGLVTFAAGQSRARATISMPSNDLREMDHEVTIRIRDVDDEESELALLKVRLQDDDQREFEANLPQNTIAFAASEITVREMEPAVQIDVMRFRPDNKRASVSYVVHDGTATAGEDYFPPGVTTIDFDRGQRTARILIPLVQDASPEDVETFTLELVDANGQTDLDIIQRIAVMIRDDD